MSLEHAILVSLAERSASGYDLARRFDKSIGHFWQASHQQIYKVLGRMEADGWVTSELVAQGTRPDKKVYSITEPGRARLTDWLATPTPTEAVRSEFALKIRALHLIDRTAVLAAVATRRAQHEALLADYLASEQKYFPDPSALADADVGPFLALRGGISLERNGISWCDEILETLEQR